MPRQLQPLAFTPLPLGAVRPLGWLQNQLRIQADGLSGHLDEFWPDIQESRWFGGEQEGWERAPYWLDGVIPLAYLLDDDAAQREGDALRRLHPGPPGRGRLAGPAQSFIPETGADAHLTSGRCSWRSRCWCSCTTPPATTRIVDAAARCLRMIDRHIDRAPLFNWAQFRWFEALIALYLAVREHRGSVAARPGGEAARAGFRLGCVSSALADHRADAQGALELHGPRGQQRDGAQGARALVARQWGRDATARAVTT